MAEPHPSPSLAPTASRNALATVAGRLSNLAVGLILTPFLVHRIGPELYGVLVATSSAYDYLSLLRGGLGGALRRFVTVHHHAGRAGEARRFYAAGFWWSALMRMAILAAGVLLAAPLARFLRVPEALLADCVTGIALVFLAAVVSDTAILFEVPVYATGRNARLSLAWGAVNWVRLAFAVAAFRLLTPALSVYGGAMVATETVALAWLAWMAHRSGVVGPALPRPEFGGPALRRELFRYGGLALLSQAATLLYLSADHLLIGRFFGAEAVTHYALGTRWFPLILGFVVAAITSLTPLFTSLDARGEVERSRDALRRVVAAASVIAVPACLVPCVVGDLFLAAWVGPEYRGSAVYLIALLVPLTLEAAMAPVWMALTARGRIGLVAVGSLLVAAGNVGLSLVLALGLGMGLLGFALGNTAALLARNGLLLVLLRRAPDPGVPGPAEVLRSLPRAVLGGLPGLALLFLGRGLYGGSLAGVIAGGIVGGALSLAGAALAALGTEGIRRFARVLAGGARRDDGPGPPPGIPLEPGTGG